MLTSYLRKIGADTIEVKKLFNADISDFTTKAEIIQNTKIINKIICIGYTSTEIADQLKKQKGITIDKRKINLDEPIRVLGSSRVEIKIHPKVTTNIRVDVKEKNK